MDLKYLELLAEKYPTITDASSEIVNLGAIMSLPKGTEHFMSDLHGEYEAFNHILQNCSGVIKEKIDLVLGKSIPQTDRETLATVIYYPIEKLAEIKKTTPNINDWYKVTMYQLIDICRNVTSKYSRSHIRKALPEKFVWIIEELMHADKRNVISVDYCDKALDTMIELDLADQFIEAIAISIKRLAVDTLHIVGDIYDRGAHPEKIMDLLMQHHSVDIQWGNHDILWMGACAGSQACMMNVLNVSLTYRNTEVLEQGYGIPLRPLAIFAQDTYKDVSCYLPKGEENDENEIELAQMRKANAVIMFKLEGQAINRNPSFEMHNKLFLNYIDYNKNTICLDGKTYDLLDSDFPTIDPTDPYKLTEEEMQVVNKISHSFMHSPRLKKHVNFLYERGSLYLVRNNNLLFHGCIPFEIDGEFMEAQTENGVLSGKAYMDYCEKKARQAFYAKRNSMKRIFGQDFMWYLWCGKKSPLFGRFKMTTFERLLIKDEKTHIEEKNPYYKLYNNEEIFEKIAKEFGLTNHMSHIINGHVPVKSIEGESPIKANGRLIVIDGGFCRAYHATTGISGYTLIYSSYGMRLSAHTAFKSREQAIMNNEDIHSQVNIFERVTDRIKNTETDKGKIMQSKIDDLNELVEAYRSGRIKQK